MESLLNVSEASKVLNISKWTLMSYTRKGKLACVRIGKRLLWEQETLSKFIADCRCQNRAENGGNL